MTTNNNTPLSGVLLPTGLAPTGAIAKSGGASTTKHRRGRRRVWERFALNARNPREQSIGRYLEGKRAERQFTATIRDSVELYARLEAGDPSFLISRFPNIQRMLAEYTSI